MSLRSLLGGIVDQAPVPYVSRRGSLPIVYGSGGYKTQSGQLEAFSNTGVLHGVVSKLASTTSLVKWNLFKSAPSGLDEDRVQVTRHAALIVQSRPNPWMGWQEFAETFQQHIELAGEGWWVLDRSGPGGSPLEMWPVRPDRMKPVPSRDKFIAGYIYCGPDGEEVPLSVDQVIFLRTPDPRNIYRGLSPISALAADLGNEAAQAAWSRSFFNNSANPGGIIKVGRRLGDGEWEELVTRWNQQHRGVTNAGRVAVLEEGDFIPLSYTQKDMQFVESRGFTKQAILDAYAFPKFGLGDVDDVNRATAEASMAMFSQTLSVPRLERIKAALNGEFLPMFGATARGLEFDYENPVPADQETENDTLTAKVSALVQLIDAGADSMQACDAVGLPHMDFTKPEPVKVPSTIGQPAIEPGEPEPEPMPEDRMIRGRR